MRALIALAVACISTAASLHLFFTAAPDTYISPLNRLDAGREQPIVAEQSDSAEPAPAPITISTTLDRTASIESYLRAAGMDPETAKQWAAFSAEQTSNRYFHSGHPLTIYKDSTTGEVRGFRYGLDYKTAVTEANLGSGVIKAAVESIQYFDRPVKLTFAVTDSFRRAAAENGIPQPIVETLMNAFADRHNLDRLAPGSAVKLIYREKVSHDGIYRLAGGVEAAQIRSGDSTLQAFAFRDEEGRPHLYDEDGQALGSKSLRFPIHFKYISSGFTFHRYHPILHEYRPHVGVDLVARYGEPVRAVADGKVKSAGWQGELGKCVRIAHSRGLVSIYGHLSRISSDLEPNSYVRMGQVIGYVGSTGLSTGPHLHFALEKNGEYLNPLYAKIGENHPVSPRMQALFEEIKQRYESALDSLPDLSGPSAGAAERKPAVSELTDTYHLTLHDSSRRRPQARRLHVSSKRSDGMAPAPDAPPGASGAL